jgi:hypothetical protein
VKHFSQQGQLLPESSNVVAEVIDERIKVYGDPKVTFPQIAQVWSGILGYEVKATDVPLLLIGMKLVRTTQAPDYSDNSDDVEGYLDIFRKLVGDDMVKARSVDDYVARKFHTAPFVDVPELEPEPMENDKRICINAGAHMNMTRHTKNECPLGDKNVPHHP